ncbi:MAG: mechanosensitive ion channel family protein [gamma proteobacterium symbiont of Taylorina sp.]|nr:mechanosensitive ion channel family protein [gamma proteobacterium symbiont of Taylorina sp.]
MKSVFDYVPEDFRLIAIIGSIILITIITNWIVNRAISRVMSNAKLGKSSFDQTTLRFFKRLISFTIYTLGISATLTQIPEFEIIGHSLLAGAGILTVVGGLASQQILGNIVGGFMIIFFRPFKIGDKITLNNNYTGIVEDINLRETVVRDNENNRVIIPNSQVNSQIIVNTDHTDSHICKFIDVGIGYSSDVDKAMSIMIEEIGQHPLNVDIRTAEQKESGSPIVIVRITSLGDSSVNLRAMAWAENSRNGFALQCDSFLNIKRRFDAAGIEIPFPQTMISFAEDSSINVITTPASSFSTSQ